MNEALLRSMLERLEVLHRGPLSGNLDCLEWLVALAAELERALESLNGEDEGLWLQTKRQHDRFREALEHMKRS